ncbi:MAG: glutamine-hydrolyzing GMP synthase [Hydrogenibacillus schlegelii]|uniref:GMP synthase (glutamine-hydrolyzing) n=1 Tax=Hydrogenibacillus schlegelii TaxID=1484 RepID=A0A947CZ45_HYDSH|nr:glutamine-hydrolyzing GMP synthase [Hydrogenibacillus schlegelii]
MEVETRGGMSMDERSFALGPGDGEVAAWIEAAVREIRRAIGEGRALIALSGGVDSAVAAALVHRAIGDRLQGVFVDHGLLRKGEKEEVLAALRDGLGLAVEAVDASERFLQALAGVSDPEEKRRRIGRLFIDVFEEAARRLGPFDVLVQGTIAPDVTESGHGGGRLVKSHHNVGGLPASMRFRLVEPLRALYKDDVRRVGRALGLPEAILGRHPFPGPGLAVRVLGPVTAERLSVLREADARFLEEIRRAGLYGEIWQAFCVLLDSRSVGIGPDGGRRLGHTIALRAITSRDATTADIYPLPPELVRRVVQRIIAEVPDVVRVVWDVTPKPPATIEWE